MLDGEDVSGLIRTPELATASSQVAAIPAVRELLVSLQRQIGRGRDMVSEGRDQGTVVFPDAGCKFFLSADPEERARRRHADLASRGIHVDVPTLLAEQAERDERDSSREVGPLRAAADAVHIDTTHLTLAQVVEAMEREVRRRVRPAV
jgi:cytidylate kinase